MSQTEQYKYDIAGKLAEYVKPSGTKIVYDYDKLNNLVKKEAGDETPVTYGYDSMGFRVAMKDATGDVTYSYDAVGNATKVIHHNGDTVTYEYDKFGRLTKIAYPDGDCTSYEYDLNDRLVKVTGRDNKYHRRSHKSRQIATCGEINSILNTIIENMNESPPHYCVAKNMLWSVLMPNQ